ncbi:MAG: peptide chain release factor-like protein [Verrucomicrobiota bacterium]|nr:peptide chain release factor-like protein [Verrucomicrobiota bacterium]
MLAPSTIAHIRDLMTRAGIAESDLEESFILGGGPGGQKTNKTSNVVRLKHCKSGAQIRFGESRSREDNRWLARRALAETLLEREQDVKSAKRQLIEKKRRQKRRRSRRQKQRMLDDKHAHSEKKAARRSVDW